MTLQYMPVRVRGQLSSEKVLKSHYACVFLLLQFCCRSLMFFLLFRKYFPSRFYFGCFYCCVLGLLFFFFSEPSYLSLILCSTFFISDIMVFISRGLIWLSSSMSLFTFLNTWNTIIITNTALIYSF